MESKVLNSEKRSFIRTQIDLQRAVPYIILALLAIVLSVSNSNFLQISTAEDEVTHTSHSVFSSEVVLI